MKRMATFVCIILFLTLLCSAQENGDAEKEKNALDASSLFQPVRKGDKFIKMGLSLGIPLFNSSKEKIAINPKIYPGGTIDLGFAYYGNGAKYFGMIFRFDAGVYYQYTPEWSIGGDITWSVVPQWYKEESYNRTGNFLNIRFGARYHF